MGAHPVHRLPQQAPFRRPLPETTPVLVGRLEGDPGQQKAVRNSFTPEPSIIATPVGVEARRDRCVAEAMPEFISEKKEGKILRGE